MSPLAFGEAVTFYLLCPLGLKEAHWRVFALLVCSCAVGKCLYFLDTCLFPATGSWGVLPRAFVAPECLLASCWPFFLFVLLLILHGEGHCWPKNRKEIAPVCCACFLLAPSLQIQGAGARVAWGGGVWTSDFSLVTSLAEHGTVWGAHSA